MTAGIIHTETKHYAICPECGGKIGAIDHLVGDVGDALTQAGPWFCDDCGHGWLIRTNGCDVLDIEPYGTSYVLATVTLVLPPQAGPIVLTLHTRAFARPREMFGAGSAYYYDEHTCPTNWMRDVAEIRIGDNADPHGLFKFQKIRRGHLERDHATQALKHPIDVDDLTIGPDGEFDETESPLADLLPGMKS